MNNNYEILVSEAVGKGHPDKICDQISDQILDACLTEDKDSRVACEVMAANSMIVVSGEVTTKANLNIENQVWKVLEPLGYKKNSFVVICNVNTQSPEIQHLVNKVDHEYGAGDQGITFGYATNETKEYLPIQYILAINILRRIEEYRVNNKIAHTKPDMKSQVEMVREDGKVKIKQIILSVQHEEFKTEEDQNKWKDELRDIALLVVHEFNLDLDKQFINVNKSGTFILGGPVADTGLTGRKLQVDTYGCAVRSGGGALSGKDYTKVDRTGAYLARWIAKNVVHNHLADKCEIGLSWQIGGTSPDDLIIDCFNTNKIPLNEIKSLIYKNFSDLNLTKTINDLNLQKQKYIETSVYGHFTNSTFPWEQTFDFKK